MEDQPTVHRRSVLKTTGGLAGMAAMGSLGLGTAVADEHNRAVRVNQVGYRPGAEKIAVVVMDQASGTSFEVVDQSSGESVYSGELSEAVDDDNSNRTVRHADFSEVEEPGEYVVEVGDAASYPFEIGDDVYDEVLRTVGRLYTLKRSGVEIDDPETGLSAGPGHLQDEEAQVMDDDPLYSSEDTIDASGGWYDAGDYGKYTAPSAITVGAKQIAYERNPEAFEGLDYNFPPGISEEDSAAMPDVLAEIKWKLEWLEKVQRSDGSMWFIVSGTGWPGMHESPTDDTQDRYLFGYSSAATAMSCAVFAQAARIFDDVDGYGSFADRMLENAEDAFAYLEDNPDMVWEMSSQQDAGSGPYHRGPEFEDPNRFEETEIVDSSIDGTKMERFDRFWAAAELLKTTGDSSYHEHLEDRHADLFEQVPIDFDWYNGLIIGQHAYLTADAADDSRKEDVRDAIATWAERRYEQVQEDGFNNALVRRDYHWASVQKGASFGAMFMVAGDVLDEPDYIDAGIEQLHHVLGRSATGYSYMTGVGDYYPENPHDRLVNSTGTLLPGMVVGGPNYSEMWPEDGYTFDQAPYDDPGIAHLYDDVSADFMVNEWAINYSAPAFWLLAEATATDWDTSDTGACEEGGAEGIEELDNGQTVCDVDGDGEYRDVTGDGSVTNADVTEFFQNQHVDPWDSRGDLFDFNGDDTVSQTDVIELFSSL